MARVVLLFLIRICILILQEHGAFNGSFAQQYLYWITQDVQPPHDVVALRRSYYEGTYQLLATTYSWPYLEGEKDLEIPVPTTPVGLKVSTNTGAQVYYNPTKNTELYLIVNYTNGQYNNYSPAVVTLDITK